MDRRHLRYLIALAEEGGFTRAAERVGIAQPPFSKQIRDLEREVGALLVQRTPRGSVLTPAGTALVTRAREIELLFASAATEARRIGQGLSGRLRVGFTESGIFHPLVVQIFLAFRARYPDVDLVLEEQLSTTLIAMLTAGELDAAFIRPPLPAGDEWACRAIVREPMVVAFSEGHALTRQKTVRLQTLEGETFVFFHRRVRPGMTDTIISACERAGFEPRTSQVVPKITSALRLVAAGAGVTVVPASLASMVMDGVRFVALDEPTLTAEIAIAWRPDTASALLENFIRAATELAEQC